MKYLSKKNNLIDEIFIFINKNYESFNLDKDKYSTYKYEIRATIYNSTQLKIVYIFNSSDLDDIKLYLDEIVIAKYDNSWNSKFKKLKKIYTYLKEKQEDVDYTKLYNKIISSKPITESRAEKIKELTK
jgi:hypothetical protein